jgi:hypothetical protein
MPKASPRRGQLVLMLSLAALGVVTLLAVVAADTATVVRRGDLLPSGGDNIRQIDLAGRKVYLDDEFSFRIDHLTSWTLIAIGGVAALGASLVGFGAGRTWQMLTLSGAAAIWLGLDEGFALHETIGHNLGFLGDLPGVRAPDDVIIALYLILAIAFAVAYRDLLAASRTALGLFAAGVAIATLAGVLDASALELYRPEDVIEAAAGLVLLAGYVALARALVRRELGVPAPAG